MTGPSDAAILERAKSLCNSAMFTVALQRPRLQTEEPEDRDFVFRYQADIEMLMVALRRLRRTAELARRVPLVKDRLSKAINDFDHLLPDLKKMRDVSEHFDDYALEGSKYALEGSTRQGRNKRPRRDKRHHPEIGRQQLQVSTWDGTTYQWLVGCSLNVDTALAAAEKLFEAVKRAVETDPSATGP